MSSFIDQSVYFNSRLVSFEMVSRPASINSLPHRFLIIKTRMMRGKLIVLNTPKQVDDSDMVDKKDYWE